LRDSFLAKFDQFAKLVHPHVPFTELNTVWRYMQKDVKSILDIGCGKGKPMEFINRHKQFHVTGVKADEVGPVVLGQNEKHEKIASFIPHQAGDNQKLEFLLYKNGEIEPYLEPLRLRIDVK